MRISIRQYTFSLRDPFTEGTIITKAEAQALNGLRAENIRNNVARWIAEEAEGEDGQTVILGEETLAELQRRITEYDLGYQFTQRGEKKEPTGQIEVETEALARERVETRLRREEQIPTAEDFQAMINREMAMPEVQAEARRRVATRQELAAKALAELL